MRIKPKKRLGQNFIHDKNILSKIVASLDLAPSDTILEIGGGSGELTCMIAPLVHKVSSLEIDPGLCALARKNLQAYRTLEVINRDILKFDIRQITDRLNSTAGPGGNEGKRTRIKVVGNIPYYISTPIIQHLLHFTDSIDVIFLTVQKEFAERMCATHGSKTYGSLSCFVQYYLDPKILFIISNSCFYPKPKVDSAFVRLGVKPELPFSESSGEKLFFAIVRTAFMQRRKVLRNSLDGLIPWEILRAFFEARTLSHRLRPENLSLEDFVFLTRLALDAGITTGQPHIKFVP